MTSFPSAARKAGDPRVTVDNRILALRESVARFCPYGFRATWHHVLVNARVPRQLTDDPDSLCRAAAELVEARQVWMTYRDAFADRRRREKALGRRDPVFADRWYSWGNRLAYCPNPTVHPRERLVVVVQRVMEAYLSGRDVSVSCPACGSTRPDATPCPRCGVDTQWLSGRPVTVYRWRRIWQAV
ncbi:endogenous inhibitor of DNA gyrase (YacG/DUF329 family) [Kibdelosporangium banguiense]|uniref:Endogenous inhibitor of DNA gyrase (YacG/DUF329 family) n=1 Tax=Kibdelosporangium banguiense TaxID=1365924 RepID=A0ABS4TQZ9_9PSEU|nr:hypothetical protein [Kibdelosporangium banguiense]MBP2326333.1 endogenous inhibitor of DNA gyrase (YacG/DUF329 family) [Kibdelosporangium banguiense]